MTDSTRCPQCGGELPANFPPGICPSCLLKQGMSPSTLNSAAGGDRASGSERRRWTAPTPAELAPRFPQLEIVELLGQGGMGAVYKVRQRELDRWVALKILPDEVASDPTFAERFQREARALAQLGHQHIVTVYEFGQRAGVYFLLMEYVDGVTLRQAIRAGQVTARDALNIVTQICDALQFAHDEGVVHRDIKPENILIDRRGRVKIADFGLAKLLGQTADVPTLTGTHQVMGTPVYMAPEQMEGTKGVDHRADIFSLGVVFYELLTGELPLGRFAPPSQKYSLDVRLDEVVLRTLEKEPDRRYQQASDVKVDVESIRNPPASARRNSSRVPGRPWPRTRIAQVAIIALGCGLLCAIPVLIWQFYSGSGGWGGNQASPRSADQAEKEMASAKYMADVERQRLEQQQQQQLEELRDPIEVSAVVRFTADGVTLNPDAFSTVELSAEQRVTLEEILTDIHRKYLTAEAAHTERMIVANERQMVVIGRFDEDLANLEQELWTAIDTRLPIPVQRLLRQRLPLYASPSGAVAQSGVPEMDGGVGGMGPTAYGASMGAAGGHFPVTPGMGAPGMGTPGNPVHLRYPQLLGWKNHTDFAIRISLGRQGRWFSWSIEKLRSPGTMGPAGSVGSEVLDRGEAPELPAGLRRFWQSPAAAKADPPREITTPRQTTASQPGSFVVGLAEELQRLDELHAGEQTPWNEVERQTSELLDRWYAPEDYGRIHLQAARIYGQSGVQGQSEPLIRHAQEALKYVRDPVQRGWLFMNLGRATEPLETSPQEFVRHRGVATRWYLKGYLELLPYNLPDKAPDVPAADTGTNELRGDHVDPERTAAEVRLAALAKVRQEAELVRDLVRWRDQYIDRLRELYGRLHMLHDSSADAQVRLHVICQEILKDRDVVDALGLRVWPPTAVEKPPAEPPAPATPSTP